MSYKENLLTKIAIDRLVDRIKASIGTVESGKRIDKALLKQLMGYFPWKPRQERDLELYLENETAGKTRILVLDNDLTIYNTTVDDVVLRKSPTVKEMVSIRNAIKILNDSDVVVSKKTRSLETIQSICIDRLDLSYTPADIDEMAREGVASLDGGDADGVAESLMLFAELLGLAPAPKSFGMPHHELYGKVDEKPSGEVTFGPLVMYSHVHGTLTCLETVLSSRDKERLITLKAVAAGDAEAAASGSAVFDLMKAKVLAKSQ
ncbi:conserved hypothetical protein [Desulfosarcina cetonica]|nr:conserved hypothetical protein [Desulfosarcina cetonica]